MDADVVINVEPAAEAATDNYTPALAASFECHGRLWEAMMDSETCTVQQLPCVKNNCGAIVACTTIQITCCSDPEVWWALLQRLQQ